MLALAAMLGASVLAVAQSSSPAPPNAVTSTQTALGKALFFDTRLSADGSISCASCHRPDRAFTDGKRVAEGIRGQLGTRNTPSLLDVGARKTLTWDGRETRLEAQVVVPFTHSRELGMADTEAILDVLRRDSNYPRDFAAAFNDAGIDAARVGAALATYLRTLRSDGSAFDRFASGEPHAISDAARRGYQLFRGAAGCHDCHRVNGAGSSFTDEDFHRVGIGVAQIVDRLPELTQRVVNTAPEQLEAVIASSPEVAALGRFLVTRNPRDIGAYRTPSLRNVAVTAPYMHDGSVATLRDAVDREIYYRMNEQRRPIAVSVQERDDLVAFLEALTSDSLLGTRTTSGSE